MRRRGRFSFMAAHFILLAWSLVAQAQAMIRFDIPSQPLADSLRAVGSQTHTNILFDPPLVAGRNAPPLKAELTTDQALARLLAGTGIEYEFLNETTVVLAAQGTTQSGGVALPSNPDRSLAGKDADKEGKKTSSEGFRVAQVDQGAAAGAPEVNNDGRKPADQSVLQEVVVTAQKREERLLDVPISMVALSANELQERQVTNIDDLTLIVPGISIESSGWQRRISLRGIGNTFGTWPTIGMYLDEADVTMSLVAQLSLNAYDLDRVEVLRGPQGTLYGEGSAGGTIRFIAKDPNLQRFQFDSDYAALFTQYGAPGQRINAVANLPLIADTLGLRISGAFDHEGGWIDQPATDRQNINSQNLADVRIKGLWQPTLQLSVSGLAEIHRNDASTNQDESPDGTYTQVFGLPTAPAVKDYFSIYNLTMKYDSGSVRFLNTSSYVHQDTKTSNFGYTLQFTPPGTAPYGVDQNPYEPINSAVTEEFRVASTGSDPWQWTAGAIYRHVILRIHQAYIFGTLPLPPDTPVPDAFPNDTTTRSNSWAPFGDMSYRIADRLTLGAGIRYFHDSETFSTASGGAAPTYQAGDFHSLDPRVYAQYKLTDDANIYASAGKGFRSGGFNAVDQPSYGPESVKTYELGTKLALLSNRLHLDADVFYSQYTDYQVVGLTPAFPVNIISNAGDAQIKGVEWDILWRPFDLWLLSLNGDYLDTKFTRLRASGTSYNVNDNLDLIPKYAVTASIQRDFTWSGHPALLRLDYNRQGKETFRNRSIGPFYFSESDTINMLNCSASIDWNDNLRLGVFAQNLLNDRGVISPIDYGNYGPRSRPRTFGLQVGVKFN